MFFFFKAGGLYSRGGLARSLRRLSVHGPVPVPVEHILPLPMIIRSWWPYILITAPAHCDMQNWSGLLPKTEAGMPMRWTWTGRQPQLSVFSLSSSPWLLGLLEWGDWVYVIIEQQLSNPWSYISNCISTSKNFFTYRYQMWNTSINSVSEKWPFGKFYRKHRRLENES